MPSFTERIPHEIVVKTLQLCTYTEVLIFSQTCKTYHNLVTQSSRLQLQIELQSSGHQISAERLRSGGEDVARRLLDEFKRFRDGWLYLKIGEPLQLEPAGDLKERLYDFRQGYYAVALRNEDNLPSTMKLTNLYDRGSPKTLDPGIQYAEFHIDPSQGLLVLVDIQAGSAITAIHLRSIDNADAHKSALHPDWTVQLPFRTERRSGGIIIEVMDELLAVKYISSEGQLSTVLVWSWKTGQLLNRIDVPCTSCAFGFITADSLILFQSTQRPSVNLLVYNDIRTASHSSCEYQPNCNVSDWPAMTPALEFGFPEFPKMGFAHLFMRSQPVPTVFSSGPATFLPSPEAGVIQLSMAVVEIGEQGMGLHQYQVFLSKERLLKHLNPSSDILAKPSSPQSPTSSSSTPSSSPAASTVRIPWGRWGEHTTRWFDEGFTVGSYFSATYGTQSIQTYPSRRNESDLGSNSDRRLEHLAILDFHPPTIRRFSSLGCDKHLSMWPSKETRTHFDSSCADKMAKYVHNRLNNLKDWEGRYEVFVDTIDEDVPSLTPFNNRIVVTRLPYRVVARRKPVVKHSGWLLDTNLIVGMPPWRGESTENIQNEYTTVFTPMA